MGPDFDVVLFRKTHRFAHCRRVGSMETARDICQIDVGHHRRIIAKPVQAEPLAHIAIDGHPHAQGLQSTAFAASTHCAVLQRRSDRIFVDLPMRRFARHVPAGSI